jgi:ribonuclease J
MSIKKELVFCPLGGAGEIGMNLYLYGYGANGDYEWIIVDIGVTFTDESVPGVEVILPDISFIKERKKKLLGIFLTHAHEDHVGAISHLWGDLNCNIYATPFTAEVVKEKFREKKINISNFLKIVELDGNVKVGPFNIDYVTLTHSILEPSGLLLRFNEHTVFHTADWKVDENPLIGEKINEKKLIEIGNEGVHTMICDSTNVFNVGSSGSEKLVRTSLYDVLEKMKNRVVITAFASNVARMETVFKCAEKSGRLVSLVGRSMSRIYNIAKHCGYLSDVHPPIDVRDTKKVPKNKLVYLCTGSQGEQRAALSRIASNTHPDVRLDEGDNVIFSSRIIPGNEKKLFKLFNEFSKRKINVLSEENSMIHVSGHPGREDLKKMYNWIKPKILIPVHGEDRHLSEHVVYANECGIEQAIKVINGELLRIFPNKTEIIDRIPVGKVYLDGNVLLNDSSTIIKDRKKIAFNGFLNVSIQMAKNGNIKNNPIINLLGVPFIDEEVHQAQYDLEDIIFKTSKTFSLNNLKQEKNFIEQIKINCRKYINDRVGKKPVVLVNLLRS